MTTTRADELAAALDRILEIWNEHTDREAWLDAYESLAPGGLSFEDPVGSPRKSGRSDLAPLWETSVPITSTVDTLLVCGNEAAAVMRNEGVAGGRSFSVTTVETYVFGDDGSVLIRVFSPQAAH